MVDQNVAQQVQAAWDMSEDDLYKHLGMASLGTSSFTESIGSMKMLTSIAANVDADVAARSLGENLLKIGMKYFKQIWNGLKEIVCTIYSDKTEIEGKDLATYIAGIVLAAGAVSNPLAVVVITIAVKIGLDKLCAI